MIFEIGCLLVLVTCHRAWWTTTSRKILHWIVPTKDTRRLLGKPVEMDAHDSFYELSNFGVLYKAPSLLAIEKSSDRRIG